MKKLILLISCMVLVHGFAGSASAAPISGILTLIDDTNSVTANSSYNFEPHTPISGTIDLVAMTMTIDPFDYGGETAVATSISLTDQGGGLIRADMLFDWGMYYSDVNVIAVWDTNPGSISDWAPTGRYPATGAVDSGNWQFAMIDDEGDFISGHPMVDGPAIGASPNFDFNVVPEPSSVLLFGSGLMGLISIRRKWKK